VTVSPRTRWIALGLLAVLVVGGLSIALAVVLLRPAPTTAAAPAAQATAQPSASPSPAPAAGDARQHQQYRAYVSALVQGGTAVIADIGGLEGCRDGRPECVARLGQASNQVAALRRDLTANPAPSCLDAADERLQDALAFQQNGLDIAQAAVRTQNRLRLVQGLLLTAVGLWRSGQAIVAGRQSDC